MSEINTYPHTAENIYPYLTQAAKIVLLMTVPELRGVICPDTGERLREGLGMHGILECVWESRYKVITMDQWASFMQGYKSEMPGSMDVYNQIQRILQSRNSLKQLLMPYLEACKRQTQEELTAQEKYREQI
ncbi:hypothetical protein [Pseudomonas phage vB_PaeM_RP7]|uniref:Uncharacterized protein n=1 Tax=Pseudomonas phage PAP-JP TaxID=2583508 RepID=A0A5C1K5B2_9CAUD|nr:hypothetical protein PAPJP_046 [Pseudomonas phage PAP-JP]UKH48099.1 MAG: hypothetical protein [Pseudomonas phage RP4]WAB56801.1 hypothetical protein [Pseudomonas phage vB_PaeM_RP15]WAB56915.1 hypothetical protein [Pseudomonas phage vB_PaeM_RP6]WAB57176.1 hypothetical protein [Pseudomonas phage vB_PaeM_RP7]WAB57313.1 hypothetical protein [Pseudomonas phage vB_PaeM_RP8]WAB57426.1 hypothetical protein [Pseudomonas phage vB_PaeM_RP9]WAB57714.1 hypothetical protein [Pseudomonas phage vB_PaeM_R